MLTTGLLELEPVGRVVTPIRVENLKDLWDTERGSMPVAQVRRIEVMDALVDTGSTLLALPKRFIEQLGLTKVRERTVVTTRGVATASIFDAVRLTIMDRQCVVEVMEVSDVTPALVGQIPLEVLDLVVNPGAGTLTGNPAHGGEHVLELL
jgi:aspartyl protease family protein